MWSLGVETISKPIKASLLCRERPSRGPRGLCFERAMHPLVPAVLLGMGGLDQLGMNAEADPPHRERRESAEGTGSKRRAVIGANPLGQAEATKEPLEYRPTRFARRLEETAAAEQKARGGVLDGERV